MLEKSWDVMNMFFLKTVSELMKTSIKNYCISVLNKNYYVIRTI